MPPTAEDAEKREPYGIPSDREVAIAVAAGGGTCIVTTIGGVEGLGTPGWLGLGRDGRV